MAGPSLLVVTKNKKELKNRKHKEKSSGQTIFLKGGKLL
jgi:hypothetical protein